MSMRIDKQVSGQTIHVANEVGFQSDVIDSSKTFEAVDITKTVLDQKMKSYLEDNNVPHQEEHFSKGEVEYDSMRISKDRYYLVEAPKRSKANKPVVGFSGQARRRNTQFLVEYYALVMLMDRDRGCEGMIAFKLKDGAPKRTEVDASDVHSTPLQIAFYHKDITKLQVEVTTGTIAEIEAIVVREDMQVAFEDVVDEFTLKWARATIKGTKVVTTTDLAQKVVINEIAESMMPFNTNYKDTRSFGVYIAAKLNWLDHLSYAIMYEITKLEAHCLSAADVICARNQLMSPLMLHIDGSSPAEEDFGHQ
ncbi:hypothetical protein V6N12_037576 [Hibiscus sabdariffa]|uniref:Uncharacterized protein n=1 Tax=Hibiscus sabdariffa TaxID=183260 RepID=A0ABR2C1P0_9ROSI